MRTTIVLALFALARPAAAQSNESWPEQNPALFGVAAFVSLSADLTLSLAISSGQRLDRKMSALEIIVTAPQAGLLIWQASANPSNLSDTSRALLLLASAWPAALTVHGAWSLAHGAGPEPQRLALSPMLVGDGDRVALGLSALGRF